MAHVRYARIVRALFLVVALAGCTKQYTCEACADGVCDKGSAQYRSSEAVARCTAAESLCGKLLVDGNRKSYDSMCAGRKISVQTGCDESALVEMKITCETSRTIPLLLDL